MSEKGYSILDLSRICEIPYSTMERYVNKKSCPNVVDAIEIARCLGVLVEDLFT